MHREAKGECWLRANSPFSVLSGGRMVRQLFFATYLVVSTLGSAVAATPIAGPGHDIEMSRMVRMRDDVEQKVWITKLTASPAPAPTNRRLDGYALVEWIARQPWSNGQVVMYGGSFVRMTRRTATQHPPHLAVISPYVPIYPGRDVPNTNGFPPEWTAVVLSYISGRTLRFAA